jgi:hypothetical protein
MSSGQAVPYYQHGIFCIRLNRAPSARKYQDIALGIDPGSKREGYTVATKKSVVLNITTNTPDWVKSHVETRRSARKHRRRRKTPYRACRNNRSNNRKYSIPPATKARWQAKLRIITQLNNILPISLINVEDIIAPTKKNNKKWNLSFSPLETGKTWFYSELEKLYPPLMKTRGFDTKQHRDQQGYKKSKQKLVYTWDAHNVDSHSLAEMALSTSIIPYTGMYKIEFLEYHRRQLHVQNKLTGGIRKQYGTTISFGMSRGSIIRYKNKLVYLGGSSLDRVSIHDILTGRRIHQRAHIKNIKVLYITKQRVSFIA